MQVIHIVTDNRKSKLYFKKYLNAIKKYYELKDKAKQDDSILINERYVEDEEYNSYTFTDN